MSELESATVVTDSVEVPSAESAAPSLNLGSRPDVAWLNDVEGEIDDVDLVLKCLARDSDSLCQTCTAAERDGVLDQRPVLARCASTKQR